MNDPEPKKVGDWITHGMNDPAPERYYDWILWKFRKEIEMEKLLVLDFTSKLGE